MSLLLYAAAVHTEGVSSSCLGGLQKKGESLSADRLTYPYTYVVVAAVIVVVAIYQAPVR